MAAAMMAVHRAARARSLGAINARAGTPSWPASVAPDQRRVRPVSHQTRLRAPRPDLPDLCPVEDSRTPTVLTGVHACYDVVLRPKCELPVVVPVLRRSPPALKTGDIAPLTARHWISVDSHLPAVEAPPPPEAALTCATTGAKCSDIWFGPLFVWNRIRVENWRLFVERSRCWTPQLRSGLVDYVPKLALRAGCHTHASGHDKNRGAQRGCPAMKEPSSYTSSHPPTSQRLLESTPISERSGYGYHNYNRRRLSMSSGV